MNIFWCFKGNEFYLWLKTDFGNGNVFLFLFFNGYDNDSDIKTKNFFMNRVIRTKCANTNLY